MQKIFLSCAVWLLCLLFSTVNAQQTATDFFNEEYMQSYKIISERCSVPRRAIDLFWQ